MKARTNTKPINNANKEKPEPILVSSFSIGRVTDTGSGIPFADVTINGVTVYGCAVRSTGQGEAFLAWPTRKGQDGRWYKHAWAPLSQEDQDHIIQAIYDKLDGKA